MNGNTKTRSREARVAAVLVFCVLVVAFWEVMSNRSMRPHSPFALTGGDFDDFTPEAANRTVRRLPVSPDPLEPNILVLLVDDETNRADPVLVRLVHGYNMVDCMRIKGETVELLHDTRAALAGGTEVGGRKSEVGIRRSEEERQKSEVEAWRSEVGKRRSESGSRRADSGGPSSTDLGHPSADLPLPPGLQFWRLTSSTGAKSVWVTAMLRAGDLSPTAVDTRDMAFPRVGTPDNPGWFPQGLTWRSLRHPIRNGRLFLRAKWNSSRADWLTFLGLKQPAWASDELLTLVGVSTDPSVPPEGEDETIYRVLNAHQWIQSELRTWRMRKTEGG